MHYIVGHSFLVTGVINAPGVETGIVTNFRKPIQASHREIEGFQLGAKYQIFYIKPTKGKFSYVFKGPKGLIQKDFLSVNEAEACISRVSGDTVPNYQDFYNNRKSI